MLSRSLHIFRSLRNQPVNNSTTTPVSHLTGAAERWHGRRGFLYNIYNVIILFGGVNRNRLRQHRNRLRIAVTTSRADLRRPEADRSIGLRYYCQVFTAALIADIIVLLHLGFILFAAAGGLLVLRWPRLAWFHLPCVAWGFAIEMTGGRCPLTPLEWHFRHAAGEPGYAGDFIARYLIPVIYPADLTRGLQIALGIALLLVNAAVYAFLWHRHKKTLPRRHN